MAKYNLEQLQQQNTQEVKKTRNLAELGGIPPVEKKSILETAGQFVKDVAVETTKPVVQSLLSPYQAVATAFNIARAPSKEKVESETAKTTAVIKRMKELEKMGQTKTSEYSNLVSQLKQKSEAYKKSDTFVAPETISTGIWGDIETPKTVEEVLGTGAKTLSLAASPAVGGALWGAGEAMQQNKGLGEVLGYTVAGGALGKVGELAFKGLGTLMKVSGKALAATKVGGTIAGSLSATEKNAERVMASLIKPLKKNLSFGKRPALELAREVAKSDKVPSNWDDLVSFTSKAKQKSGKEIRKFYDKADKTIKTRFNAETALKTIDNAMDEAAAKNNTALMNRLSAIKQAITQTLVKKFDKKTGQWIIKSTGTKDLTKLKPSEVQNLIREIGEQIKWTENRSDDLTVNRALTDTYRALRRGFESGLSKENKTTGALARRLNEKYGNLTSALDSVNYRRDVVNRQALVSLTDQQAAIAGGLFNAIKGGGNIASILAGIGSGGFSKMIKSPWFATNLTKTIMKLSPAKRQSIFLKYPMLRGVVNQTLKTAGKGIEKFGSVLAGTPKVIRKVQTTPVSELSQKASKLMPFGATIEDVSKEGFKKAGMSQKLTQEAKKYKTADEFVNSQKTYYRATEDGKTLGTGEKWAWTDKKTAEDWAKRNNAKVVEFTVPDEAIDSIDLSRIKSKAGTDRFKFDTSKAKTKSQLTDIWNKAQEKPTAKSSNIITTKILEKDKDMAIVKRLFNDTEAKKISATKYNNNDIFEVASEIESKLNKLGYKKYESLPLGKNGGEFQFVNPQKQEINAYLKTDGKNVYATFDREIMDTGGKLHTGDIYALDDIMNKYPDMKNPAFKTSPERTNYLKTNNITLPTVMKNKDIILDKFFKEVKKNEQGFINITEDISRGLGNSYVYRMKSPKSVLVKMKRRGNKFTIGEIDDVLASTIITDKIDDAIIKAKKKYKITNIDDFRKKPTFLGYKAVHLDVELPNGQVAEIQINTLDGLIKKEEGHKTYDKWRKYIETAQGTELKDILEKVPEKYKKEFLKDVKYSNDIFSGKISVPGGTKESVESRIVKTKNLIDINNYGMDKSIDKI
jgi:ppGpp synthetase/RelA/SpoT-type nucleotidyltranferase